MRHPFSFTVSGTVSGILLLAGTAGLAAGAGKPLLPAAAKKAPSPEDARFFETSVRPVLATRCQTCHGAERQSGGLRVDSLAALLKGGASGPALLPGKPEQSLLVQALTYQHKQLKMPPGGKLPDRQQADLARWVSQGAPWPNAASAPAHEGVVSERRSANHWSFHPVRRPALPVVKDRAWVKSPIDAFILAGLEKKGLHPAPPADRRTLLRRATFDLTGLPPTPEEMEAFLADRSPDAWKKVIERLLASPAYGERWGRHWLDVARYADSNGLDENVAHGNAWRYRDWVVQCFNQDKPYDQFVTEQLAGDLLVKEETSRPGSGVQPISFVNPTNQLPAIPTASLAPALQQKLIATGFLTLGPKVLAEADKDKMVMDIVDEQIDTTGRAFMGLTLGCARCHDHKFDPLSTEDYYGLAGIFKSTRTMESLKTVARWWENAIPSPQDLAAQQTFQKRIADVQAQIQTVVARSRQELLDGGKTEAELPKDVETAFKPETKAELKVLRDKLAAIQKEAPEMPSAMGVAEAEAVEVPVHIRGDHLNLGKVVPRRFPIVLAGQSQPAIEKKASGRLELARWLVDPKHPLTSRVFVNRVWRWHFGKGIVASTDNFGFLGETPTHPELLDYLASGFASGEWSGDGKSPALSTAPHPWAIKDLHRILMLSSTYQMSSRFDPKAAAVDPENSLRWRAPIRRLEAEELRDAILSVSGTLDRTMGGSLLQVKNHEFFFDHTSKDGTKYTAPRRSLYMPVVRNNVYDVFQLFDFADPAVLDSNRASTTVAPQALFWMNSDLVKSSAAALASKTLARTELDDAGRIGQLHLTLYGRPATPAEAERGKGAIARLERLSPEMEPAKRRENAWAWYTHALLAANEFIYLR